MVATRRSAREATPTSKKKEAEATKANPPAKLTKKASSTKKATATPASKKKAPAASVRKLTASPKKSTAKKATPAAEPDDEDDAPLGIDGLYVIEDPAPPKRGRPKKQSPKVKDKTYKDHHNPADDAVEDEPVLRRAGRKGSTYKPDADEEDDEDGEDEEKPVKRGRGRPKKTNASPKKGGARSRSRAPSEYPQSLGVIDAKFAIRDQLQFLRSLPRRMNKDQHRNDLRAAYFMLKSALFGGGLYEHAPTAEVKKLRDAVQKDLGMDMDPAFLATDTTGREGAHLMCTLRWEDLEGTGKAEAEVVEYLTRIPVYGDLNHSRMMIEDPKPFKEKPQMLAEWLNEETWPMVKMLKYGMARCEVEGAVEDLYRRWKLLTREEPRYFLLDGEKGEMEMKKRVRDLWSNYEEGYAATVGRASDSSEEDDGDAGDAVPSIEHGNTGRKGGILIGRTPSPAKTSRAPTRSPSRSPGAKRTTSQAPNLGPILHNEQTRLATPRGSPAKKATPSPSPGTKQRRETVRNGMTVTPKRGSGSSGGSLRSREESAAAEAQLMDEMEAAGSDGKSSAAGSKRGTKSANGNNTGESSRFSSHRPSRTSSPVLPPEYFFRGSPGGSDHSSSDSDHGFPHLPPHRRPGRRSASPAPPPPPDRSGITGPPVGSQERLQAVLRHVATAEEQRVFDGYEGRVVRLPRKYTRSGADGEDDSGGDEGGHGKGKGKVTSPRRRDPRASLGQHFHGGGAEESDPVAHKITTVTNPERIEGLDDRANPFHEKLPGVETWYQRMPNQFPFGETPYQEAAMSRQINEDLSRSHEREVQETEEAEASKSKKRTPSGGFTETVTNAVNTLLGRSPSRTRSQSPEKRTAPTSAPATAAATAAPPSPWDLPNVKKEKVEDEYDTFHRFFRQVTHHAIPPAARKAAGEKRMREEHGGVVDGEASNPKKVRRGGGR